ncbi:hypothetical protein [Streptomyces sp. TLI_146]|uniref:SCO2400 family protein n=1 Tax=Streptomyces sp. TLI_146 TaxID=1938858 RepID=UPI000CC0D592|nr:hypothetical protein [Streptomyces sp. TLI_146]PKV85579.1 hypothetical protein BX283_3117 [Streptomyces sp. TLI_146]
MDYCHACRRHLNGALACAGCGTPAEELRQPETIDLGVYEAAASGAAPAPVVGHRRARREPPRAARPRRRARKQRGRLVLFGSAGVVLAAGALGLARLAMEPPPDDRGAATSVHEEEQISQESSAPAPDASDVGGPKRPSAVPAGNGHGKQHPRPGGTHPGPGGGTGSGTGPPSPGGSHPATGPTGAPSAPAPTPTGPDGSPLPSTSPQPSTSDAPPPPAPPPSPTPTQTCNRFLWWCL